MRTKNRASTSSSRTMLLLSALGASTVLLPGYFSSSSSSSLGGVDAFGTSLASSSSSSSSTRRRKSRLYLSSTTPPPRRPMTAFHNDTTQLSAFSLFPSSADVAWSKNDADGHHTDKSSLLVKNKEEEEEIDAMTMRMFPWQSSILPVVSSALLITGSTFGAGSLVLPELAQGAGLANTFALFLVAYIMNLISGLCIAQVAIQQKTKLDMEAAASAVSSPSSSDSRDKELTKKNNAAAAVVAVDVPCSFKEFVESTTGSHALASFISTVSFGVNSLVWAFVLSRVGILASQVTMAMTHGGVEMSSSSSVAATTLWAAMLVVVFATQSPGRISQGASLFVTPALFASFGALLVPGLAAVPHDFMTVMLSQQPGLGMDTENAMSASMVAQLAPVVYMSTIYQNVVPTVAKLQDYHPTRTMAAIVLGSAIPLLMYLSWCYACLGGGIDLEALTMTGSSSSSNGMAGPLLTVFSLATLAGSSIGCGLSCASEIDSFVKATLYGDNNSNTNSNHDKNNADDYRFPLPTVLASVGLPLIICHVFGHGGGGQAELTGALSVAGGLGSPLLYGIIPVVMAWKQSQQQQQQQKNQQESLLAVRHSDNVSFNPHFLRQHNNSNKASLHFAKQMAASAKPTSFVPASSLGVLGVFSTGMLGSEIVGQVSQVLAAAAAAGNTALVPVAAVVEQVEEMAMAMAAAPL